jgi:hypothetical protein
MATGPTVDQDNNKVILDFDNVIKIPIHGPPKLSDPIPLEYVYLVINKRLKPNWDRVQEDRPYINTSISAVLYIYENIQVLKRN